ncbi:porin [Mesorhizobium sp. B3-1-9]|uniref:porin n=1 Tax=unclassified Mesorhizobium TaxID=325217 RepID=UPI00112CF1AB|nr:MULTISPECIES: porin [unclassified Mesorhizobium]TPI41605.1 porin [Mesorhizobium sp. B3-1-9]TPI69173.1 porin [Mesorhizobium sp. B3-1-8]
MNIKSLLLGSAAALVAVSGARAADAVTVAEPEPAEYVKICDVYGAGYFYIPGTETCLRVGGYIRYDASAGEEGSFTGRGTTDVLNGDDQRSWHKNARFALKTWTGQETELGTLKTYTETRFDFSDGATSVNSHFAWVQLGGLRIGADESAFDTFQGYAGSVINDTIVPYGGFDTNLISYTFDAGNGFSAIVSFEEGNSYGGYHYADRTLRTIDGGRPDAGSELIDSYVPHIVGGVKWTQGWGGISGVVAYNSNWEEWAGKVRLDVNVNDAFSLFVIGGYGTDKNSDRNFYKPWGGNWAVWGGGTYKFNEKTSFNLQVSYDEAKEFGLAANVAYTIVPGFSVITELDWAHNDHDNNGFNWTEIPDGKKNALGGFVRFQRDF